MLSLKPGVRVEAKSKKPRWRYDKFYGVVVLVHWPDLVDVLVDGHGNGAILLKVDKPSIVRFYDDEIVEVY